MTRRAENPPGSASIFPDFQVNTPVPQVAVEQHLRTDEVIGAVFRKLTKNGYGPFIVRATKARGGPYLRIGELIKVEGGATLNFKASPTIKKTG